jgi:hypothetical protein
MIKIVLDNSLRDCPLFLKSGRTPFADLVLTLGSRAMSVLSTYLPQLGTISRANTGAWIQAFFSLSRNAWATRDRSGWANI